MPRGLMLLLLSLSVGCNVHDNEQSAQEVPGSNAKPEDRSHSTSANGVMIRGHVMIPPSVLYSSLAIRAASAVAAPQMPASEWNPAIDVFEEACLEPDGQFQIGPFMGTEVRIAVIKIAQSNKIETPQPATLIEETLRATPAFFDKGDAFVDWKVDLAPIWPGELSVKLNVNGGSAGGLGVCLIQEGGSRWTSTANEKTNSEGVAVFQPLPGMHTLRVLESLWSWPAPERVLVASGAMQEVTLDLPVALGDLLFLDRTTGSPLNRQKVMLYFQGNFQGNQWIPTETGGDGRISLILPQGKLYVTYYDDVQWLENVNESDLERFASIEWSLDGPVAEAVLVR